MIKIELLNRSPISEPDVNKEFSKNVNIKGVLRIIDLDYGNQNTKNIESTYKKY